MKTLIKEETQARSEDGFKPLNFNSKTLFRIGTLYQLTSVQRGEIKAYFGALPMEPFACTATPSSGKVTPKRNRIAGTSHLFTEIEIHEPAPVTFKTPLNRYELTREARMPQFGLNISLLEKMDNTMHDRRVKELGVSKSCNPKKPDGKSKAARKARQQARAPKKAKAKRVTASIDISLLTF